MLRFNTDYFKVNLQINEGGKYFTLSYMIFQPEYLQHSSTRGILRVYLFGKVFVHWFEK